MNNLALSKELFQQKVKTVGIYPLDILLIGATGAGKSSTVNALFGKKNARVGEGVDPETMDVSYYQFEDIVRFWDTPGLGDSVEKDKRHQKKIIDSLCKTYQSNGQNYGFIDLAVIILDSSTRDLGTVYKLINQVAKKCIQPERILIILNQCDIAMKGRGWDEANGQPASVLKQYYEDQAVTIQTRIRDNCGLNIPKPIHYSALYKYELDTVLKAMCESIPDQKRPIEA